MAAYICIGGLLLLFKNIFLLCTVYTPGGGCASPIQKLVAFDAGTSSIPTAISNPFYSSCLFLEE